MMAEADGKLTGRPGICMVTRGPGATNASAGVHIAFQDSTPMILFIGQVGRDFMEREAFQEIDYRRMFGQLAKWVAEIDDAGAHSGIRRPRLRRRDLRPARARSCWRCRRTCSPTRRRRADARPYRAASRSFPARRRWRSSQRCSPRPSVRSLILGGSRWDADACDAVRRFAEANDLPVAATFRRQDRFDNTHPCYVGDVGIGINPKLKARVDEADLLVVARRAARRDDDRRLHAARHSRAAADDGRISIPAPRSSAASTSRILRSTPRRAALLRCSTRSRPVTRPRWADWRKRRARRLRGLAEARQRYRAGCRWPRSSRWLTRNAAGGRDLHQRRRQFLLLAPPLPSLPAARHAACADQRLDGLRLSGCGRGEAPAPGADGRLLRRRRRLPDDGPGARDRRAVSARPSSCSSSTTACTARSACIRSASFPAASWRPSCATRILSRWRKPMAPSANTSSGTEDFAAAFDRARNAGGAGAPSPEARSRGDHAGSIADRRSARRRWRSNRQSQPAFMLFRHSAISESISSRRRVCARSANCRLSFCSAVILPFTFSAGSISSTGRAAAARASPASRNVPTSLSSPSLDPAVALQCLRGASKRAVQLAVFLDARRADLLARAEEVIEIGGPFDELEGGRTRTRHVDENGIWTLPLQASEDSTKDRYRRSVVILRRFSHDRRSGYPLPDLGEGRPSKIHARS